MPARAAFSARPRVLPAEVEPPFFTVAMRMSPTQADDSELSSLWNALPPAVTPPESGATQARSKARLVRAACLLVSTSSSSPCCPAGFGLPRPPREQWLRRRCLGLAPIQCSSLGARRVETDPVLMMVKTMNREINGTLEMKLWFWWCNGDERERGGVPMPPLIQLTERA